MCKIVSNSKSKHLYVYKTYTFDSGRYTQATCLYFSERLVFLQRKTLAPLKFCWLPTSIGNYELTGCYCLDPTGCWLLCAAATGILSIVCIRKALVCTSSRTSHDLKIVWS